MELSEEILIPAPRDRVYIAEGMGLKRNLLHPLSYCCN